MTPQNKYAGTPSNHTKSARTSNRTPPHRSTRGLPPASAGAGRQAEGRLQGRASGRHHRDGARHVRAAVALDYPDHGRRGAQRPGRIRGGGRACVTTSATTPSPRAASSRYSASGAKGEADAEDARRWIDENPGAWNYMDRERREALQEGLRQRQLPREHGPQRAARGRAQRPRAVIRPNHGGALPQPQERLQQAPLTE